MGADMALCWLPSCKIDDDRRHELQAIIEALTEQDCKEADGGYDESLEAWKTELTDAVDWWCDERFRRDIAGSMVIGDGYPVDITGGMCHGDGPTDAYDWFDKIGRCEKLFAKLEEWAKADYAESRPKTRESEYLASGGSKCPYCKSEHIEGTGNIETDADYCANDVRCLDCGGTWEDIYKLAGIEEVDVPEQHEDQGRGFILGLPIESGVHEDEEVQKPQNSQEAADEQ